MPQVTDLRTLLESLIGSGFTVSISIPGTTFMGQKVVAVQGNLVYTVDDRGVVRTTLITAITSVDF